MAPFAFALGALTGLLLLNQIARRFGDLIGKGLPWSVIVSVFALSIPFILAMTVPMACLVAVLQAFSRLGADAEITAMKASGVNLVRVMRPVLVAFILVALGEFLFVDQMLPATNHQLKNLLYDITRKKPTFELREQAVNQIVTNQLFLRAGRIDQATNRMRDIVIYDLANPTRRRTIYADSGYVSFNANQTDLFLTLYSGYIHDYDRAESDSFRRIFYESDVVRVAGVQDTLSRTQENDLRSDREMGLCEMESIVARDVATAESYRIERERAIERDLMALVGAGVPSSDSVAPIRTRRNLTSLYCGLLKSLAPTPAQAQTPPRRATPFATDRQGMQLRSALASIDANRQSSVNHAASYQVEIHKKYSLAVSCIVFVLIGAPIALRFPRGGVGLVIGSSVAIFGFYYIGLIGGESLADRRVISPFWAMWTPNLVMAAIGIFMFLRLGHEHATARGGTFGERLRARFRRRRRRAA